MAKKVHISPSQGVLNALRNLRKRLVNSNSLRKGNLVFRLKGQGGGDFCIRCSGKTVRLHRSLPKTKDPPLIEMIGQADSIKRILDGASNPMVSFRRGNFRIRGDIKYISELAMVLGLLRRPL